MPLIGTRGGASAKGFGFTNLLNNATYYLGLQSITSQKTGVSYGMAVAYNNGSIGNFTFNDTDTSSYNAISAISTTPTQTYAGRIVGSPLPSMYYSSAQDKLYVMADYSGQVAIFSAPATSFTLSTSYARIPNRTPYPVILSILTYGITVDSSSNIYILGQTMSEYTAGACCCVFTSYGYSITKLNSAGTAQWSSADVNASSTYDVTVCMTSVDSSGNVYISADRYASNSAYISKFNSSGVNQWRYLYSSSGGKPNQFDLSADGAYLYLLSPSGSAPYRVTKIDTSTGDVVWCTTVTGTSTTFYPLGIKVGTDGNIYANVGAYDTAASKINSHVLKISSAGSVQWQRNITVTGAGFNGTARISQLSLALDANNNIYISSTTTIPQIFVAKLNPDGSGTGSYTVNTYPISYAASSYTVTTSFTPTKSARATDYAYTGMSTTASTYAPSTASETGTLYKQVL